MSPNADIDQYRSGGLPRELMGSSPLSLKQLGVILWAYRQWIVAVPIVLALVTAILLKFVLPKVYQATATLFVSYKVDDPVSGGDFSQVSALSFMATQVELIQSDMYLGPLDRSPTHRQAPAVRAAMSCRRMASAAARHRR